MLRQVLASGRYIMLVPVVGTFLGSIALIVYEAIVLVASAANAFSERALSTKAVKVFAVGVIEAVDVFLIAIAVYIISIGLYALFVDDTIPLPKWLTLRDLDDLKGNLISVVIAVLAVLFLREAVAWDGNTNLASFGAALAVIIAALTFFLMKGSGRKP